MTPEEATSTLNALKALRADVEQFDNVEPCAETERLAFSDRVPLYMKSYLVNWLRKFTAEHGDKLQAVLEAAAKSK